MKFKRKLISFCEHSGTSLVPWAMLGGYECECIDLLNDNTVKRFESGGSIMFTRANILQWEPEHLPLGYGIFAFPPCTHLASSGAQHFKSKGLAKLIEALTLVERCRFLCEKYGRLYVIENPVGMLSTYWREPDYYMQPNEYAGYLDGDKPLPLDAYTKKTCLWTSDNFVMPGKKPVQPVKGSIVHTKLRDAQERALFPMSFAYAIYLHNKHLL